MAQVKDLSSIAKIKVIGIGGGGNNAVVRMIEDNVQNIETYLLNTEIGALKKYKGINIIQIGKETTNGLGAGANAEVGEKAAIENSEEIKQILQESDMVFLTAGMGGGTGTGGIPVVAKLAKEMNLLTVGIVTKPFSFEGNQRKRRAEIGIQKLKENVNALIVILNDNLLKIAGENTSIKDAFKLADGILKQGIQSITDLITTVGDINIDFADIQTIFGYKGKAYMGIGKSKGEGNLVEAVQKAIDNPLTETGLDGAKGVIFNVSGGSTLSLNEINMGMELITEKIDPDANIIFGTVIDEDLQDEVIATVIATGIE